MCCMLTCIHFHLHVCAVLLQVDGSSVTTHSAEAVSAATKTAVEGGAGVHGGRVCNSSPRGYY